MLISDAQARAHLRIDDEAEIIAVYIGAAELAAQEFLNRRVFADQIALDAAVLVDDAGTAPMVINDAIRAAMLLTLGHLYANREDVVIGTISSVLPLGSRALLAPYRIGMGA